MAMPWGEAEVLQAAQNTESVLQHLLVVALRYCSAVSLFTSNVKRKMKAASAYKDFRNLKGLLNSDLG